MIIAVIASMMRLIRVIPFAERNPHASHSQTRPRIEIPAILTDLDVFMSECEVNKISLKKGGMRFFLFIDV